MSKLAELLRKKSEKLNLFSAGDRLKLEEKHIPDALAVLEFWRVQQGIKVLDLGTGGGIPGLVLAEARPGLNFILMDSTGKKITAVLEIAKELNLRNVEGIAGRFEALAHQGKLREHFDIVTARAVAELPVLLEYAAGFLKVGGYFYAWKQADHQEELASSKTAQQVLGLKYERMHSYELPSGETRSILEFKKTSKLSESYPRKDGTPKAKPIL